MNILGQCRACDVLRSGLPKAADFGYLAAITDVLTWSADVAVAGLCEDHRHKLDLLKAEAAEIKADTPRSKIDPRDRGEPS